MKPVFFSLGWFFFGLGIIGLFLPVVPTTPFMLLALWAFSRSSDRFHHWLYHHPLFGPPLQQWHQHRVIPLIAKIFAISFMCLSMAYLVYYSPVEDWIIILAGAFMLSAAIYVISKPSRAPDNNNSSTRDK